MIRSSVGRLSGIPELNSSSSDTYRPRNERQPSTTGGQILVEKLFWMRKWLLYKELGAKILFFGAQKRRADEWKFRNECDDSWMGKLLNQHHIDRGAVQKQALKVGIGQMILKHLCLLRLRHLGSKYMGHS
jgi:hypothetical protein